MKLHYLKIIQRKIPGNSFANYLFIYYNTYNIIRQIESPYIMACVTPLVREKKLDLF